MPGILERIKVIEEEMARTQKNKATNAHLCLLRAKLAKLRSELMAPPPGKSSGPGEGFEVLKAGNARVSMIGFPSVGKSSLLSEMTETKSRAEHFAFTTLTCIPGVLNYMDAKIQLLDLPGIIEGASKGKGRGRQVIAVARTSDMILMVLDASQAAVQRRLLLKELEDVGIRVNKRPPDITINKRKMQGGGIKVNFAAKQSVLNEDLVKRLCTFYKVNNCDLLFREDCSVDDLIDTLEGNRKYVSCLFVVNKIDTVHLDVVDKMAHWPNTVVCSIKEGLNRDGLLKGIWKTLDLIRVYTKPRGQRPDFHEPLIMPRGSTIEDFCMGIHRTFKDSFKYAMVWGTSAKHQPQKVGLSHRLEDEDVVQLMAKSGAK